ncbi:MAG: hypothetical protein M3Y27_16465, partial [Acidobacteriota bacterium]|nr:hypothetical protein [Acidobacteriota bacterium]
MRANQGYLRTLGYDYPEIGHRRDQSHLNLANEIRGMAEFDSANGGMNDLLKYWRKNKSKTLLISSEILEGAEPTAIAKLKKQLSRVDDCFLLVMIIRNLYDLVVSSYTQSSKFGNLGSNPDNFDVFFNGWISGRRADYFQTAKRWAGVFGWDTLRVRLLDASFLHHGDLIDDFLLTTQIKLNEGEALRLRRPQAVKNVSPGWRVVEALRALYTNRHGLPEHHPLVKAASGGDAVRRAIRNRAEDLGQLRGWNEDKGRYLT